MNKKARDILIKISFSRNITNHLIDYLSTNIFQKNNLKGKKQTCMMLINDITYNYIEKQ